MDPIFSEGPSISRQVGLIFEYHLNTMSTSELKLNLLERLALVQDAGLLQRLKQVFDQELAESDDFTHDELAELNEIDRRRKAGLDTYLSMEDAMRMIREGRAA